MFEDPEYASYIALCRELRLERKEWEDGDIFVDVTILTGRSEYVLPPSMHGLATWAQSECAGQSSIWLPRLDQWLAILEEAEHGSVVIEDCRPEGYVAYQTGLREEVEWTLEPVPSREEAVARLWMALTGREARA